MEELNQINKYFNEKLQSLQIKLDYSNKEINILKDKLNFYQKDNENKTNKINELINQLEQTETQINILTQESIKNKEEIETHKEINNNEYQNQITELNNEINTLKNENQQLIQNILLNTSPNQMTEQSEKNNKTETNLNEDYKTKIENEISEFTKIILNELKYISKFIDTYMGKNYDINDLKINEILNQTYFPNNFILNFDFLKTSIINALNREINEHKKTEKYIKDLKTEIVHYNNIIKSKINEFSELKNENKKNKFEIFNLNNEIETLKNEKNEYINDLKNIENNISNYNTNNEEYFINLYNIIKEEINLLENDPYFETYKIIIYSEINKYDKIINKTSKFKFEEILDKFIMIYQALKNDVKNNLINK